MQAAQGIVRDEAESASSSLFRRLRRFGAGFPAQLYRLVLFLDHDAGLSFLAFIFDLLLDLLESDAFEQLGDSLAILGTGFPKLKARLRSSFLSLFRGYFFFEVAFVANNVLLHVFLGV